MKYEVWCEGYAATGESAPAFKIGEAEAESFSKACAIVMDTDERRRIFDPARLTYWGCRLFDNEADARKAFG